MTTRIIFRGMTRPPRNEGPGAIHHVVPQGNGRRRIVEDDRDRVAYVTRFARISRELGWLAHASSLMDTHHHAVVETAEPNLSIGMRRLQGGHARWLNARHGREGSVFRQHFWSRCVGDEGWFFRACLYAVLNPVAAGLCAHPRDWPWCSYRLTAEGDPERFSPGESRLLDMFGDTPTDARRNYAKLVGELAENITAQRVSDSRSLWASLEKLKATRRAKVSD
jgi:putative transposase